MKIEKMDRKALCVINDATMEALKVVVEELGLEVKVGQGRFCSLDNTYDAKIIFSVPTADGVPSEFRRLCKLYSLKVEDYGREFTGTGGDRFEIVGIKTRNRKMPIIAKKVSGGKNQGQTYKMREEHVAGQLDREDGFAPDDPRCRLSR